MVNFTGGLLFNTILLMIEKDNDTKIPIQIAADSSQSVTERERCYDVYGCFSVAHPWVSENRPIALFPFTPEKLNVRYSVFTRNNIDIPYFLDANSPNKIRLSKINSKGPFYFICHGYLEGGDKLWIQKMTVNLLQLEENSDATVVSIDWRDGSGPPYAQAVANIRLVGAITAQLIHNIYRYFDLKNLDNFHFIGHSLGAHCGGYTGFTLQKHYNLALGRITGMDPAEPHFRKAEDIVRLERTDAKFVDIIHTDASPFISGGLGISETIGHVDFFPNGGSDQPGCNQGMMEYINSIDGSILKGIRQFLSCNHLRSYEFFTESIVPSCPFIAIECANYQEFLKGACARCGAANHNCLFFGYRSIKSYQSLLQSKAVSTSRPIKAFLMTNDISPFCRVHYRITVNISASMESSTNGGDVGRLWLILVNKNGTHSEKIPLEEHAGYHKPGTQRTLAVSVGDVGIPASAIIEWEYETNLLNPLTWRILMSPRIFIAWIHIMSIEYATSMTVCPTNGSPVIANTPSQFHPHNCGSNISPIKIST